MMTQEPEKIENADKLTMLRDQDVLAYHMPVRILSTNAGQESDFLVDDTWRGWWVRLSAVEGGWSDHPQDSGGATKYGITWRLFKAWATRENPHHVELSDDDWKIVLSRISEHTAQVVAWQMIFAESAACVPRLYFSALGELIFDASFHSGSVVGTRHLQCVLNWFVRARLEVYRTTNRVMDSAYHLKPLKEDGRYGPKTATRLRKLIGKHGDSREKHLAKLYVDVRMLWLANLTKHPFIEGWIGRQQFRDDCVGDDWLKALAYYNTRPTFY